jgi:hypothetical protein
MYPYLILERLAEQHQRTLLDEAAHERLAAALVGHRSPWWTPIAIHPRHTFFLTARPCELMAGLVMEPTTCNQGGSADGFRSNPQSELLHHSD